MPQFELILFLFSTASTSVVDPDGTLRVVKYTADDANGFQAEVITNGVKTLHGHGYEGDAGGEVVDNQVRHHSSEAQEAAEEDEEEEEEATPHHRAAPHQGNGQYKVHEDYDEGGGQGEKDEEGEDEGDHQEYEGSSEEGYVEADAHSQQEEASSEDY